MSMFKAFSRSVQATFNTVAEFAEAGEHLGKAAKAASNGLYLETELESAINLKKLEASAKENKITLPVFKTGNSK